MTNLVVAIRDEIRRLARKEIKAASSRTKQAVVQYRREIAMLRRQLKEQQKQIAHLSSNGRAEHAAQESAGENPLAGVRFSSRSVRAQRKRLGLSMAAYAKLLGVSALTIYFWESGRSRPRNAQLASLVAARGITKREAMARLDALGFKATKT